MAFTLEALAEKEGCTTRFVDLPEKPLQDFLIAGINAGKHFRALAEDWANGKTAMFGRLVAALQTANAYKSAKTINFGLLEAMSMAVSARLNAADAASAVDRMTELVRTAGRDEVASLLAARQIAWQTSRKAHKRNFAVEQYDACTSLWDFHLSLVEDYPADTAHHQWGRHITAGFPLLRRMVDALSSSDCAQLTSSVSLGDKALRQEYPHIKPGILADFWAVAIFLRLSDLPAEIVLK